MTVPNWKDVIDRAGVGWSEIKERLPLPWVVATVAEVSLEQHGSRLKGLCPFHPDNDPSFEIWTEDWSKWGCYPCDSLDGPGAGGGDLFDFLGKYEGLDQGASLQRALDLMEEYESSGSGGVEVTFKAPEVPEINYTEVTRSAWVGWSPEAVSRFFKGHKGLDIDPQWLHDEWNIGSSFEWGVVFPWLRSRFDNKEAPPEVVGFTHRRLGSKPYARGKKSTLYGEWRDKRRRKVIICEGETDTLWTSWVMDQWYDVVGVLGAGLNIQDEWVQQLAGRDVWLLFDGDKYGRNAARRWAERLMNTAEAVRVVPVGGGRDACDMSSAELRSSVNASVKIINPSGLPVIASPGGYIRNSRNGGQISTWLFRPDRYVTTPDDYAYEGRLDYKGTSTLTTIRGSDLGSQSRIIEWCERNNVRWMGTSRDGQGLLEFLDAERPFMTVAKAAERVGMAGEHAFVLPSGNIGERGSEWVYLPNAAAGSFWREVVALEPEGQGDLQASLEGLLAMHSREVMCSLMGWMAAAPFRGLMRQFPVLAVSGLAGAGKTTLVGEVMRVFGWGGRGPNLLSGGTNYGAEAAVDGSVGVPFWMDEYRAGGSVRESDNRRHWEQVMRNAWDGSSSVRGGMYQNKSRVGTLKAAAPLVVSGEDLAQARSLVERSWHVRIPRNEGERGPLGHAPVMGRAWLERCLEIGSSPQLEAADRPGHSRAVVKWGWSVLREWGLEMAGFDIGEWVAPVDWAHEDDALDPVLQAVSWAMTQRDRDLSPLVMERYGRLWVRTWELSRAAREMGFDTGANHKALRANLTEVLGLGVPKKHRIRDVGEGWLYPVGSWETLVRLVGVSWELDTENELGSS